MVTGATWEPCYDLHATTTSDGKPSPDVSLHYYAPVCAIINLAVLPLTEGLAPFYEVARVGCVPLPPPPSSSRLTADGVCGRPWILLSNAAVAFLLNVAAVFLVGAGSGLVLTLAGVFKDILLITGSVLVFGAQITPVQVVGYSIALLGLVLYRTTGSK